MLGGEAWDLSSGFNMMLGCAFEERVSFALDPEEGKGTFDFEIDSIAMTLWESASEFFLGTADKDCESLLSAIEKVSVSKCEADYISRRDVGKISTSFGAVGFDCESKLSAVKKGECEQVRGCLHFTLEGVFSSRLSSTFDEGFA
jgi:hypothetical protein